MTTRPPPGPSPAPRALPAALRAPTGRLALLAPLLAAFATFVALTTLAAPPAAAQSAPTPPASTPAVDDDLAAERLRLAGLDATLWLQRSAEARALARGVWESAYTALHEALLDPAWTADVAQREAFAAAVRDTGAPPELPPAILVDVDETVLDNSAYQARLLLEGTDYDLPSWNAWCHEKAAPALPGALEFLTHAAEEHGVTVFYITNRRDAVRDVTRENLIEQGFPVADGPPTVLTRSDTSDKAARRAQVAATHRVLLVFGDNLADFSSLFRDRSAAQRRTLVDVTFADRWGEQWFVLPNPTYGDWRSAALGHAFGLDPRVEHARLLAHLDPGENRPRRLPPEPVPPERLAAGPMPGWSSPTAASVWLQTTDEAVVQLRVWPEGDPLAARLTEMRLCVAEEDHIAVFELDGLTPGTTYACELYLDGRRAALPWPLRVETTPTFTGAANRERADVTFVIGSCAYVNDPPFDRPGPPYGGDFGIYDTIADLRPDFMLWMGDNVYLRADEWDSEERMRARYAHTRGFAPLQRLLGSTHHYATWDDHDYGPNDSDRTYPLAGTAREIFGDYWPARSLGTEDGRGVFRRFAWGDCEFFLLDDRTWRAPVTDPDGWDKDMLGDEQVEWLLSALRSSTAAFRFIVNGSQMLNPIAPYEGFADYPLERETLLRELEALDLDNLYFLSGDRHHSELIGVVPPGGDRTWYEFTSSPLTAGAHSGHETELANSARVVDDAGRSTFVNQRAFGLLRIRGPAGERVLQMSCHDVDGRELWSRTFQEQ